MEWIKETFKTEKPIIAMCHVRALPGDPYYDADGGMEKIIEMARAEFLALQEGGVDAVMFSNEFSLPYLTKVKPATVAAMEEYARANGWQADFREGRFHHEIYLSDPRRCRPEKQKTVIRQPVKKAAE